VRRAALAVVTALFLSCATAPPPGADAPDDTLLVMVLNHAYETQRVRLLCASHGGQVGFAFRDQHSGSVQMRHVRLMGCRALLVRVEAPYDQVTDGPVTVAPGDLLEVTIQPSLQPTWFVFAGEDWTDIKTRSTRPTRGAPGNITTRGDPWGTTHPSTG
jgi:hypothetical protein